MSFSSVRARRAVPPSLLSSLPLLAIVFAKAAGAALPDPQGDVPSDAPGAQRNPTPQPAAQQEPRDTADPQSAPSPDTKVGPSPGKRPENGYWSEGEPRWFVSTKSDLGTPYVKPYFSAGYGMPHFIWGGVDVNSITTGEFTQVYAGLRAATPVLDFAFGVRDTWSYAKPFLAPKGSFTRSDVLDAPGSAARYWAWEAEVVGILPLPHAAVVADFIMVKTLDVPDGMYLYEESYRAVIAKPFYAVLRTAVVARVLREGALKFGPLVEYVFATGRDRDVLRVGPAAAIQLTDHLEAQGTLTLAVSSPDSLGLVLGAYGVMGLRYRWATGERSPKLPWQGEIIP
jgi:hypothetical protein